MSQPPLHVEIEDEILMSNPLYLVAPQNHELAHRKQITLASLKKEKFILREKGSGTRMAMEAFFKNNSFKPDVRLELGSNEAIKQAVIGWLGLAVLSKYALEDQAVQHDVAILNCSKFPIKTSWHIVYLKGKQLSPIAKIFKVHLSKTASQWGEELN